MHPSGGSGRTRGGSRCTRRDGRDAELGVGRRGRRLDVEQLLDLGEPHLRVELATVGRQRLVVEHTFHLRRLELEHLDRAAQARDLGVHLVEVLEAIGLGAALLPDDLLELLDAQLGLDEQRLELCEANLRGGDLPGVFGVDGGARVCGRGEETQKGEEHVGMITRWR
jgi:hypothetical protein